MRSRLLCMAVLSLTPMGRTFLSATGRARNGICQGLYSAAGLMRLPRRRLKPLERRTRHAMAEFDVHLVGGVPLANAEEVFATAGRILGPVLPRIPDGEVGRPWMAWFA